MLKRLEDWVSRLVKHSMVHTLETRGQFLYIVYGIEPLTNNSAGGFIPMTTNTPLLVGHTISVDAPPPRSRKYIVTMVDHSQGWVPNPFSKTGRKKLSDQGTFVWVSPVVKE